MRCAIGILGALVVVACGVARPIAKNGAQASGPIAVDGRDFGRHESEAWCDDANAFDGTVLLKLRVARGWRSIPRRGIPLRVENNQYAEIRFREDAAMSGIDVRMPWSHVVFKPSDCSLFDVEVKHRAETATDLAGESGVFHVSCRSSDSDALDADVVFSSC